MKFTHTLRALMADHFELFMTSVGVLLSSVIALSALTLPHKSMAFIFLVWLQGVLIWAVHRHNCLRQRQLIMQTIRMVQDRVNNRLTAWVTPETAGPITPEREQALMGAALAVAHELRLISLETLQKWERRNASMAYIN